MMRSATPADLDAVVGLFTSYDVLEFGETDMDAGDIEPMLSDADRENVLVERAGLAVGYAAVTTGGEAETVVDPAAEDPDSLQRQLLGWVLDRARAKGVHRLEHWSGPRPDGGARLLAEAGFGHARTQWRMVRSLAEPVPEPVWPAGVAVRPFERDRDARDVWALVQRSFAGRFGSHERPFEAWATYSLSPGRDVVCAAEGDVLVGVACVNVSLGVGFVSQLAVDPAQQGRGIALALLHEVFRRQAADGLPSTTLIVDGENAGARRLYEKAGMRSDREYHRWERDL